jgi:hypothetical protein
VVGVSGPRPARTPEERLAEAKRLFDWSTDPAVIDRAILEMKAAEEALADEEESRTDDENR